MWAILRRKAAIEAPALGDADLADPASGGGKKMEERIVVADPVTDPHEYQRELLGLLGGQDPTVVLAATPPAVWMQTRDLSEELLARRPAPREWSVAEVLGHLWDSEIAYSFRARAILAQESPRLIGYDQDAWATLTRPAFAELLDAFAALRTANLALIRGTPQGHWDRLGVHEERGPLSFRLLTETMAGHDRAHLRQLEQTIMAVRR
jgi:DinB superfamily